MRTSPEAETEAKMIREILCMSQTEPAADELDNYFERSSFRRKESDLVLQKKSKRQRKSILSGCSFVTRCKGLEASEQGTLACKGRIQGSRHIYLPHNAPFTKKLIQRVYCESLHGGIGLVMAAVSEQY